jgi:hypothetical protein
MATERKEDAVNGIIWMPKSFSVAKYHKMHMGAWFDSETGNWFCKAQFCYSDEPCRVPEDRLHPEPRLPDQAEKEKP